MAVGGCIPTIIDDPQFHLIVTAAAIVIVTPSPVPVIRVRIIRGSSNGNIHFIISSPVAVEEREKKKEKSRRTEEKTKGGVRNIKVAVLWRDETNQKQQQTP